MAIVDTSSPPLRIATIGPERSVPDKVEAVIRRLRGLVKKGRDLAHCQEAIIGSQQRNQAKLRSAALAQSREIVQLRDQLEDHGLEPVVKV